MLMSIEDEIDRVDLYIRHSVADRNLQLCIPIVLFEAIHSTRLDEDEREREKRQTEAYLYEIKWYKCIASRKAGTSSSP